MIKGLFDNYKYGNAHEMLKGYLLFKRQRLRIEELIEDIVFQ